MERYKKNYFKEFILAADGATSVEYVIMSSLITAAIAGSVSLPGAAVLGMFSSIPSF